MNLGFLILDFLNDYKNNHTKEEVIDLIRKIIDKKKINHLPKELKKVNRDSLSKELSQIVLRDIENNIENKEDLIPLLDSIVRNGLKKNHNSIYELKKAALAGGLLTIVISSVVCFAKPKEEEKTQVTSLEVFCENLKDFNDYTLIKEEIKRKHQGEDEKKQEEENKQQKQLEKYQKEQRKKKVLTKYKKCKTIEDILKRQKELESLDLGDEYKLYKDCKLSPALQQFIYEQSILYGFPPDLTFCILATETRGSFNSSGKKSYNQGQNDYDLGLSQQNSTYSLPRFCQKFEIEKNEAYELVKNNDYANIICTFLEYEEIRNSFPAYDPEEYSGRYNGWIEWRKKEISREYVKIFMKYYDNQYNHYHQTKKNKSY